MPTPLVGAIAGLPATLTRSPLWLGLRGLDGASSAPAQSHTTANTLWTPSDPLVQHHHHPTLAPHVPLPGSRVWYLLVQEQVPPQDTFLSAQQDPAPRLGFSSAAGLRHLITVQSQESKN